jgi:hypothetical protein
MPIPVSVPVVVESNIDPEPTDLDAIENRILQRAQNAALQRAESKNAESKNAETKTGSPPNASGAQLRLTEALNQLEGTKRDQFQHIPRGVHSKMFMQPDWDAIEAYEIGRYDPKLDPSANRAARNRTWTNNPSEDPDESWVRSLYEDQDEDYTMSAQRSNKSTMTVGPAGIEYGMQELYEKADEVSTNIESLLKLVENIQVDLEAVGQDNKALSKNLAQIIRRFVRLENEYIHRKLDLILNHLNIPIPPPTLPEKANSGAPPTMTGSVLAAMALPPPSQN